MYKVNLNLFTLLLLLTTSPIYAEVYNCNGLWTNKSCEGLPTTIINERPISSDGKEKLPSQIAESRADLKVCKEGEIYISERPLPLIRADEIPYKSGNLSRDIDINGTVFGNGKITVSITAKGMFGAVERKASKGSRTFYLSEKGEEKQFSIRVSLPLSWEWLAEVKNAGTFEGYCTTQAEETAKASTKQKYLDPPKIEINQTTNIRNNIIIERR